MAGDLGHLPVIRDSDGTRERCVNGDQGEACVIDEPLYYLQDLVIQQILAAGTESALKEADLRREPSMTNLVFELDHGPKHREEWRPVDFDVREVTE
jgi:hypothetical protein